ncbi:MAG: SDR family oxidoreductase [Eubacterium sp.]|nr:SDR family oxidoreductase [Eubacterium sp.]
MTFEKKVFIVTGSASGIGKSCCLRILDEGGIVYGIDMAEDSISREISCGCNKSENQPASKYIHVQIDVRDEEKVKALVERIIREQGSIYGLVNAAGIWGNGKPFYEMDTEAFDKTLSVNMKGTFIVSKYVANAMLSQKNGKIVNISCIRANIFRNNMADYAASKGAIMSLTSAMALDLAPYNIQVNSVAPGFTYTGMTAASFDNPEVRAQSESLIPQGRLGQPGDISAVVVSLLSEMSDYMTGTNIYVDGGYHIQK